MSTPPKIDRRRFLQLGAGAILVGCNPTNGKAPGEDAGSLDARAAATDGVAAGCAAPSTGAGQAYCLVESLEVRVAGAAGLAVGQVVLVNVDDNTAAIVARDERGFYGLSAICTHSCCLVTLCGNVACTDLRTNPGNCGVTSAASLVRTGRAFLCPCHGSEFAADGTALTGPATTRLPSIPVRVAGADVIVDLGRIARPEDRA